MRIFTILILFFFTSFLVVPTIVSVINHDADISVFIDLEEDSEIEISIEEVKMAQEIFSINFISFFRSNKIKISIYDDAIVSNNFTSIFSPPPELG